MSAGNDAPVCIATTDGIAGARIATNLGAVVGIAIRSRGVGGNIMAGLDALGNGSALDEYRGDLAAIRREALARMAAEAEGLGANAVVGLRFDTAEVGREMVEVVAYGTAVVLQDCLAATSPHAAHATGRGPCIQGQATRRPLGHVSLPFHWTGRQSPPAHPTGQDDRRKRDAIARHPITSTPPLVRRTRRPP